MAKAVGQVVLGDDQVLAELVLAPNHDMAVRVSGVEVIDRHPIELGPKVALHLPHEVAGEGAHVRKVRAILGRDDEPELATIAGAVRGEGRAVNALAVTVVELGGLAIAGDAITHEVAQMRAGRLASELQSRHTGLDDNAAIAGAAAAKLHRVGGVLTSADPRAPAGGA